MKDNDLIFFAINLLEALHGSLDERIVCVALLEKKYDIETLFYCSVVNEEVEDYILEIMSYTEIEISKCDPSMLNGSYYNIEQKMLNMLQYKNRIYECSTIQKIHTDAKIIFLREGKNKCFDSNKMPNRYNIPINITKTNASNLNNIELLDILLMLLQQIFIGKINHNIKSISIQMNEPNRLQVDVIVFEFCNLDEILIAKSIEKYQNCINRTLNFYPQKIEVQFNKVKYGEAEFLRLLKSIKKKHRFLYLAN